MHIDEQLTFARYRVDLHAEQLWRGSRSIPLTSRAFAVLRYLVEHAGQVVSKAELFAALWPGTAVTDGALTVCIKEVRKALGDKATAPRFIATVHRRGYRFLPAVTAQPVRSCEQFGVPPLPKSGPRTLNSTLRNSLLVGREAELAQLHTWLDEALSGKRQIVLVTGEPGIGKTTLVDTFLFGVRSPEQFGVPQPPPETPNSELPSTPGPWLGRGQCIEHYGPGEPYMPILEALGRLCREPGGEQLVTLLHQHAPTWLVQMPALLDTTELEVLQRKTQGATRERMLREMGETLEVITAEHPLVLLLEDLHWSDASTLDLLAFLARRKEPARLVVIGTYRPVEVLNPGHPLQSATQELYAHRLATELPLELLSEADIAAYLEERFAVGAQHAAPLRNLARTLHQCTGGNPLFLVSTVDELEAQDIITRSDNFVTWQDEVVDIGIAESIRHLVARQSGRLSPEERHTLEAASMAGMEFSAAAVAAALTTETIEIERRCEQLAERQHFLRRIGVEEWPDGTLAARYRFHHAVYQQLWHERVSPTQLQDYHLHIGERKETAYGKRTNEIAAALAVHFEQSRDYERAVRYLQLAGTHAIQRSAYSEAHSLASKGLALLPLLPASPQRTQLEMTLHIALAVAVMTTKGCSVPEVGQACYRALELCRQADDELQLYPILSVLFGFYFVRAQFQTAREMAERLLRLAEQQPEPLLKLAAHLTLAVVLWQLGELPAAHMHLAQRQRLYSPHDHRKFLLFGHDPTVTSLSFAAPVLWLLGYPEQARRAGLEAVALAEQLEHPYTLSVTLSFVSQVFRNLRALPIFQTQTEAQLVICREQDTPEGIPWGMIMQGWLWAHQEHAPKGIVQIREGIALCDAVGSQLDRSHHLTLLAEAYALNDQPDEGLAALEDAVQYVAKTGERYYEAEIYRLRGELTLQQFKVPGSRFKGEESSEFGVQGSESEEASQKSKRKSQKFPLAPSTRAEVEPEVEEYFLKAIDVARKQCAKSWELRATMSLARLWQQQARGQSAKCQEGRAGSTKQRAKSREQGARSREQKAESGELGPCHTQHETRNRLAEAHQMLSEVYHWFTEGFDTKDLQEAKALLEELR